MSDRRLVRLGLKSYETKVFELPGRRVFNSVFVINKVVILGCKDGVLLTLNNELEVLHKKQLPEGQRPKKFFTVLE